MDGSLRLSEQDQERLTAETQRAPRRADKNKSRSEKTAKKKDKTLI
jgi:hypothetical protein